MLWHICTFPTQTHTIMSMWFCMLSVWRSPQSWCSCDSGLNQQDPTLTDWMGKVQPREPGVKVVCTCTHLNVCFCLWLLRLWVCAGTICKACLWMWKWMKKRSKRREGKGDHVGWISHFCLKKKKKKGSLNSDENLVVNKEKLLVTLAPVG